MDDVTGHLRAINLFARVSPEHLAALAERVTSRRLDGGEWLFRTGDPGDSMYVVVAGRVDLVVDGPEPVVVGTVGHGESVGELSLLAGEPRATAARARRDSELIVITRDVFHQLLESESGFAFALVRELADRMKDTAPTELAEQPPRTIALVPLHDGVSVGPVADRLCSQLGTLGSVARPHGPEPLTPDMLDGLEATNRWVLLVAESAAAEDPWTRYCIREADRVIGLATRGATNSSLLTNGRMRGCDLAFQAGVGVEPDLERWLSLLMPRAVYVLREGTTTGIDRMARRLTGTALGLVLGGGGARGLAHIGVVEELQRAGIMIDRIGGVSMGAVVAALFAEQRPPDEVAAIMEQLYVHTSPLAGRTIPLVALSRGARAFDAVHRLHGQRRIEGLDIPYYCVSSDIAGQQIVIHRSGLLADAVSATQALPAFVPPLKLIDRLLVDGSLFSNLPVEPMRVTGEGSVIAVDVSGRLHPPAPPRPFLPALRRWIVGPAADWAPPITETVLRSVLLGNAASDAAARQHADLVIQPELPGVGLMQFDELPRIRRLGAAAARAAIERGDLARWTGADE